MLVSDKKGVVVKVKLQEVFYSLLKRLKFFHMFARPLQVCTAAVSVQSVANFLIINIFF